MSNESKPPEGQADMMRLWFDMLSRTAEAVQACSATSVSPQVIRHGQSNLLKQWSDFWEELLRSSSFLEANRQWMSGSLESQKQMRQYMGWLQQQLQLASAEDIDRLMIAVRRIKSDQREWFEQIDERLDRLSAQVDALAVKLDRHEKEHNG